MKNYFVVQVEILVSAYSEVEASDLISEALTHNLQANKVINDWHYSKTYSGEYAHAAPLTVNEAKTLFGEIND